MAITEAKYRKVAIEMLYARAVLFLVFVYCTSACGPAKPPAKPAAAEPAAVKAFDTCSTACGNPFITQAQFDDFAKEGYKLYVTDDVMWDSEMSGDWACAAHCPANHALPGSGAVLDPQAVAQIKEALKAGLKFAIYNRNVLAWHTGITGLGSSLDAQMAFYVLDIEAQPGVAPTRAIVSGVRQTGITPVLYTWASAYHAIAGNSTEFDNLPLWMSPLIDWNANAATPPDYPSLTYAAPFNGWTNASVVGEQQTWNYVNGYLVNQDAFSKSWLASTP